MMDTRYGDSGQVVERVEVDVEISDLVCGGCGYGPVYALLTKERIRGQRTARSLRAVYCSHCGRQTRHPVTIEQFPVGGWRSLADALSEVAPTKPFHVIQGGKV